MDNKKLVKTLVVSGTGLLIIFIMVRLAFKNSGDRITDMPTIGELKYEPEKIKEESKAEQFEKQKKESDRKEMGYDNSQYVIPNFNNLLDKKDNSATVQSAENKSTASFAGSRKNISSERKPPYQNPTALTSTLNKASSSVPTAPAKKISPPASKLNYHSDYFNKSSEVIAVQQEIPKADNSTASRNPFGTITSENNQAQKQIANQSNYYCAEIYGDQSIQDGGIVLIRNTAPMQYLNLSIPRNSILYGQASFRENRVFVSINRVKTPAGESSVAFSVKDNDRIEGLYFKAPIDEAVDKTKEGMNAPSISIPGAYGGVISSVTQSVFQGGKNLMKGTSSLNLNEGYKVYLIPK